MTTHLTNYLFDELTINMQASLKRVLTAEDIQLFAVLSGDINPAHVDKEYAAHDRFHHIIGHGMWSGALISTVLGTKLPGPGTIYLKQDLQFRYPITIGDEITVSVSVAEKNPNNHHVTLQCLITNQDGKEVVTGSALVLAPQEKIDRQAVELPQVALRYDNALFNQVIEQARKLPRLKTAVTFPTSKPALMGAVKAFEENLIEPILIGPREKIENLAIELGCDISQFEIIDVQTTKEAANISVKLAKQSQVDMLMKGNLHSDVFLHAIVDKTSGLCLERRLSHCFVINVPSYPRLLLISDCAINIEPDLTTKKDILQNTIDLAKALGIEQPKAAILSAVETVSSKLRSTLDAAALCKMSERGQIKGGLVDGPLAFDNAVSTKAANLKKIQSPVAGAADILIVPDLESGNMLAKQLDYLSYGIAAGLALGASKPIVLTSRADTTEERVISSALGVLYHHYRHQG